MSDGNGRSAVLIANPKSGRTQSWLFSIIEAAGRYGIRIESIHVDLEPSAVGAVLARAERAGIERILVAGGDGTIGSVAGHLVHSQFTLGVVPSGTSNDFARSLQIPMSPDGAMQVVAQGLTTRVDAGRVDGSVFVHAAVTGINARFAAVAQRLRPRLGRLSYPVACLDMYRHRTTFQIRLITEDAERDFLAFEIAFVNAPVYGGALGLELTESDLLNHRLSVVVVRDLSPSTLVRSLPAAFFRHHVRLPGLDIFAVDKARLLTDTPLDVTLDGELAGKTPANVEVLPAALRVAVPHDFMHRNGRVPV